MTQMTHERLCYFTTAALLLLVNLLLGATVASAADRGRNGRIAFVADLNGTRQIYTVHPDGSDLFQVTDLPPANDDAALAPDFSPDGRIVFAHDMTGALELYVINADGSGLTQITNDGAYHASPHWSPDASHIVFVTRTDLGPGVVASIQADGSDKKLLTNPVWDSSGPEYTTDGKHIVFASQLDGLVSALWVMETDGRHPRRITAPELEAGSPDVSPDGRHVVVNNHHSLSVPSSIFKLSLDGSGLTPLTTAGYTDTLPVYSPDGSKILFMTDRLSPGSFDTFVMNADGSQQKRIIVGGFSPNWGTQP